MKELIERLKKATGPDRNLDLDIMQHGDPDLYEKVFRSRKAICPRYATDDQVRGVIQPPAYTGSVDDAATLIPDGLYWMAGYGKIKETEPLGGAATFLPGEHDLFSQGEAATVALAICIAALEAKAARVTADQG